MYKTYTDAHKEKQLLKIDFRLKKAPKDIKSRLAARNLWIAHIPFNALYVTAHACEILHKTLHPQDEHLAFTEHLTLYFPSTDYW